MKPFTVRLNFYGDLQFFLPTNARGAPIERHLIEKTSVKDAIESCGVPHPEVDLILVDGQPVDFGCGVTTDAKIDVYPVAIRAPRFADKRLQVIGVCNFVADGHLGKLVRDLRLVGIDVLYNSAAEDRQLVDIASEHNRALLTRDRRLLMHSAVRHGYYLRSQDPLEQTIEVLRRFDLAASLSPISRCLQCNSLLERVEKQDVVAQLKPLTKIYYTDFRRCPGCEKIYWPGSHFEKLQKRIETIQSRLRTA